MPNYSTTAASTPKLRRNSFVENHSEGNVPNSGRSPQGIAISVSACFLERAPSIPAGVEDNVGEEEMQKEMQSKVERNKFFRSKTEDGLIF
ncbi:hypothetical protein CDAR_49111 [Caerostris darwini]|uniref:Uncharacterized protein n=1 Tax=Caerostris darwini TaxID=1538125 RepID=A0AAV4NM65_9ARAC|nr:hypothetical protein CDAR_49111 [Caerostris darwini]